MWGTDETSALTGEGQACNFIAVGHCSSEYLGIHAARRGTRYEALEPIRQGVSFVFGGYAEKIAIGLKVRHDHGSQFISDDHRAQLGFLGIESSPAFVRQPEGNGVEVRMNRSETSLCLIWWLFGRTVRHTVGKPTSRPSTKPRRLTGRRPGGSAAAHVGRRVIQTSAAATRMQLNAINSDASIAWNVQNRSLGW